MALDYTYDGQLRRYFLQFVRIFSGFQYLHGKDSNGNPIYRQVPVTLAMQNRQIGHIINNNSENVMLSTPQMTAWMSSMKVARNRTQNPNHISTLSVKERDVDPINNKYLHTMGRAYTVERMMAIPYDITMQLDIWTSNESQKHQLMEQILTLFNPSIDLQTTTNPLDNTSLTIVELEDITWSNRSISIGTNDEIDIATLSFNIPIWISPPAKVTRSRVIEQIIVDIGEINKLIDKDGCGDDIGEMYDGGDLLSRLIVTPGNHQILVDGSEIILLSDEGLINDDSGNIFKWSDLFDQYSKYRDGISQIRLKTNANMDDHETDIVGSISYHPTEKNKLLWTMDISSLPGNNLSPIDGIIDPHKTFPGNVLPAAQNGQRYLLIENIRGNTVAWGVLDADENDIIEYDGVKWFVSFDASEHSYTTQHEDINNKHSDFYVLNSKSGKQLKWLYRVPAGTPAMWTESVEGYYGPGFWRLFL